MARPYARASASVLRLLVQRRVLTCIPLCGPLLSEMRPAHVRQRHLLDLQAHYIAWEGERFVQGSKNRRIARREEAKSARGIARAGCARSTPSSPLRRRPQSEFLKRSGGCLSDWALSKGTGTRGLTGALRRRPQSEFLKRCGDCLSDWALPKNPRRVEGRPRAPTIWANLVASPARPIPQPAKLLP